MTNLSRASFPAFLSLGIGAAGAALRMTLYGTGFDGRHLLTPGNPLHLLSLGLALALAVWLLFLLRREGDIPRYPLLPGGIPAGLTAAAVLALNAWQLFLAQDSYLTAIRTVLGCLCALCVMLNTLARSRNAAPRLAAQTAVCLFFALDMLCRYQSWSGNPQLADYLFALPASVCLCVTAYQSLALPQSLGNRKVRFFACLMALCLCLYSLVGSDSPLLYLGGALFAWSELSVTPPQKEEDHVSA